jgi:hypothetical protein
MRNILMLGLALACLAFSEAANPPKVSMAPAADATPLDTIAVHALYLDGDFEKATASLERALAANPFLSHEDSVFAFKHLGVMEAAREETREKGKYFMLQLLTLEPTAKIMDMYASDMIYMIFRNIKEEFDENKLRLQRAEAHVQGNQASASAGKSDSSASALHGTASAKPAAPQPERAGAAKRRKLYWLGGVGAALVGVGVVAYLMEDGSPANHRVTYDVE